MGMKTGKGKNAMFTEINITPLTDIFLVLLIIMMVVAPTFQSVDNSITGFDGGTLSVGGGAIINKNGGELTVVGSTFENTNKNQQFARHGAYIYNAGENSVLNIIKSDFINGYAQSGAVAGDSHSIVNIVDSLFENNSASSAAGFWANYGVNYTITGSDFINNSTTGGGGAISGIESSIGEINASAFTGNSAAGSGGAINLSAINTYATGAQLTVSNSTFEDNHAVSIGGAIVASTGSTLKVYNSDFINNYIQGGTAGGTDGGAIYSSNGIVEVVNSYFENNRAGDGGNDSGGGIESHGADAKLTVTGSDFISNSADDGGAIINYAGSQLTVSGSNFQNNTVRDQGGAIANTSNADALSNATIKTSTFTGNSAANYGGAVYNTGIIDIQNATFGGTGAGEGNSANYGGAVCIRTNATPTGSTHTATITNTDFINNIAGTYGGAIYAATNTVTNINGSRFEGNSAVTHGGAIESQGNLTIDSSDFIGNSVNETDASTSGGDGGAIYGSGTLTVKNSLFENNSSAGVSGTAPTGGAIRFRGNASIYNTDFISNTSEQGGAVYLDAGGIIDGSTFSNNSAASGGAIAVGVISAADLTLSNSIFTGNSANGYGGAIYSNYAGSSLDISNSIFGGTGNGEGNTANHGGAIYIGQSGTHTIDASQFVNNSAAEVGGAIYNATGSDLTVTNSVFEGNRTTNTVSDSTIYAQGGAIYTQGNLTIDNSSFSNNHANRDGGAIHGESGAVLTVTNSDFNNNSANWSGAAIYGVNTTINVSDSTFSENVGGNGVIFASTSEVTVKDSLFNDNTGASLWVRDGSTFDVSNSIFKNNTAGSGILAGNGGAILIEDGTSSATISDSLFDGNTASQYGAAVYNAGGNVTIKNSTFTNNDSDTSVIYNTDGGTLNLISEAGKSSVFSGNTSTGTKTGYGWGVIGNYYDSVGSGSVTLTAEKGGSFIFSDNIASRIGAAILSDDGLALNGAQGSLFSFKNNQAAAGGAIFARGNADINVDTIRFEGNKAVLSSVPTGDGSGGAIHFDQWNSTGEFTLNANKAEFVNNSATNNGGAIWNNGTFTLTNGYFEGNSAGTYGGAIYNNGTMNLTNSYFKDNTTGQYGGAIFNTGNMVVSNSTFIGNTSGSSFGGQIYNQAGNLTLINSVFDNQNISGAINLNTTNGGVTNIIADNGTSSFNGQISNNGTTNINAGNNGTVILGNYNSSASGNRVTNINNTGVKLADGVTDAPADGEVIFGGNVLDGILNLYNGTMTVMDESRFHGGTNEAGTPYQLPSLNLYGGTLNLINDKIGRLNVEDFSSVADANLNIDADMTARSNGYGLSDSIYVHGTFADNSAISLNAINILNDGDAQHLTIFDNPSDSLVIDAGATYTNGGFKYTFTQNADDKGVVDIVKGEAQESTSLSTAGFVAAMNDTSDNRAFSATEDVDVNEILTKQGGTLTIFGNKHNFNGKEGSQLNVNSGTLNIYNVGEITDGQVTEDGFNGFANPGPGGVLQLDGVTNDVIANVYNSVFSGNSTTDLYSSGAIKVSGENALLNAYNSYFKDNKAHSQGAILVQYGTANIVSSVFDNNYAQTSGGALGNAYGTVTVVDTVFKNNTSGGDRGALVTGETATTAIYDSTFIGNSAANTGGAVGNAGDMSISYSTFGGENAGEGNSAGTTGGAINNTGTIDIDHTTFTGNSAGTHGGAIYNDASADTGSAGATVNISDSEFTNNSASSGSAIYNNAGTVNVENSKFDSNKSTANAAVVNKNAGTMDIVNSQFTNNVNDGSATTDNSHATGGALYNSNENSVMNVIATNGGSTSFTGNSTATWGGAIDNDAGAELYLFADKGSKLSFENNTAETGGAIHNSSSSYTDFYGTKGSVISFVGNNATGNGGAIDTFGTTNSVTINGDTVEFKNNSAGSGGAIRNASVFTIAANNAIFSGNSANQGGAINNTSAGILNLITDNGLIEFKDNTAAGVSNDMYNAGTANLNTGAFGEIVFNGRINGNNTANGTININNSGTYTVTEMSLDDDGNLVKTQVEKDRPTGGEVTFNDLVTNQNINLYNGTLTLDSESNFNATDNLALYGGTLNLVNNATGNMAIGNFTSQDGASIFFDANLATGASDSISANTASGTLNIGAINILADGDADTLTLFTGGIAPDLNALKTFTNDSVYEFSPSATAGVIDVSKINNASAGLPEAVADTTPTRAFSATGDVDLNVDLGDMRGTNSTLTIFGNNHNINGNGHSGVGVAMGKTLNIYNVGSMNDDGTVKTSWNGFRDRVGSVVSVVDASLNIYDSVFSDNAMTANSTGQGTSGAIKLQDGAEANITNSYFVNNRNEVNSAGAIGMQDGIKAVINNTVFDSNYAAASGGALYVFGDDSQAGSDVDIIGSTFKNNTTDSYGGAIALNKEGSTADIESTSFNENIADINGGAISVNANNTLNVTDSNFNKNNAAQSGGAITTAGTTTITGSTFEGNTSDVVFATAADGGGAIYATGGTLNISGDTTFTGNKTNAAGGAINVAAGSATIRDTKFENNESALGGAINAYNDTVVNIYNSEFINNTSTDNSTGGDDGGAIYNLGTMLVDGSTFEGNSADDSDTNSSGGAIENGAHGTLTVNNSTFTGNTAYQAGAVMTNGGETDITGSTFTGNSAVAAGGAISTISGGTATVTGSTFTGNSAGTNGGAVHNSGGSTITITDSTFGGTTTDEDGNHTDANTAQNGGAIANDSASTVNISATDGNQTTFTSNKATNNGGAISNSGTLNINTPPVPGAKVVFDSNSAAASGGAIYTTGTANVNGAEFNKNTAAAGGAIYTTDTTTIADSTFSENEAASNGGAVVTSGTGTTTVTGSTFDGNKAATAGGAIYNDSTGKLTVSGSEFTNNTAVSGGAIDNNAPDGTVEITSSSFTNNSATTTGGAIRNIGNVTITDSVFSGNTTPNTTSDLTYDGGAIYNDGGSVVLTGNNVFTANKSSFGGAIYSGHNNATLTIDGATFGGDSAALGNSASTDGGAIKVDFNSSANISNTIFNNNTAVRSGGAIAVMGQTTISDSTFTNNSSNNGGAVWVTGNADNVVTINNTTFDSNNVGNGRGGAIANYITVNINDSTFTNNTTAATIGRGGAIYNGGAATTNIAGSTFIGNTAVEMGNDIYNDGGVVNFIGADDSYINGGIAGRGTIGKADEGTLHLQGSNYYFTGTTTITGGKIAYTNSGDDSYLSGTTNIGDGATLEFNINEGQQENVRGNIRSVAQGNGTFVKNGAGTVNVTGTNAGFSGTTELNEGKITYNKTSATDSYFSGTTNVNTGATLEFNVAQGLSEGINGNIASTQAGSGAFVKTGDGTVTLDGDNSAFTGTTTVQDGTLQYNVDSADDRYFGGSTEIQQNGTLNVNTAIAGNFNTTLTGNGAFIKTGAQTLTLEGNNAGFTGSVDINEGTLSFSTGDGKSFFGSSSINITGSDALASALDYTFNEDSTFNKNVNLNGYAALNFDTNNVVTIANPIVSTGSGNSASFNGGTYIFNTDLSALAGDVDFSNTTVQIGSGVAEFGNDALNATASNTNFDLDNEKIETLTFDNITFTGDTNLSFDIDLGGRDDQANPTTGTDATSDRIVANTGSGNVTLDTIKIIQDGEWLDKELNIVDAEGADIVLAADGSDTRTEYTSNGYEYEITKADTAGSIIINTVDYNIGEDTLKKAHIDAEGKGNRGFTVNNSGATKDGVYKVLSDLGTMGAGDFTVKGLSATESTISGNNLWTLFNVDSTDGAGDRTLTITDVNIANATVDRSDRKDGAAVYINGEGSTLITRNAAFTNNEAQNGGAIYNNGGTANITNTNFSNNDATTSGGAIYAGNGSTTSISGSTFENNTSNGKGGAISNYGDLTVDNSNFIGNVANDSGTTTTDGDGGAINHWNGTLTVTNSLFENNRATGSSSAVPTGGAIRAGSVTNIYNSDFNGNTAYTYGGAIRMDVGGIVDGSSFNANKAESGYGGAIAIGADYSSTLGELTVSNSTFTGNSAGTGGGAIWTAGVGTTVDITGSTFGGSDSGDGNTAQQGGAIYNSADATVNITDSTFTGNSAGTQGGAIYNLGTMDIVSTASDSYTSFSSNTAAGSANDIYTEGTINFKGAGTTYVNSGIAGSEAAQIVKQDEGILNLKGSNSNYLGSTTINGGSIVFDKTAAADTYLGGTTEITQNGTLEFKLASEHNLVGYNNITGDGLFKKTGTADLNISGSNSAFDGVFEAAEGTTNYIQSVADGYFNGVTQIDNGAALVYTNTQDDHINGLTGQGTFTKNGEGTANLSGNNSGFTGVANITEGSLNYNKTDANESFIAGQTILTNSANLTFDLDYAETVNGNISGAATTTIDKLGSEDLILTGDNSAVNSTLTIEEGNVVYNIQDEGDRYINGNTIINAGANLVFENEFDTTFNGTNKITGAGNWLINADTNELTLSGQNNAFDGVFEIASGTVNYVQSEGGSYVGGTTQLDAGTVLNFSNTNDDYIHGMSGVADSEFNKNGAGTAYIDSDNSGFDGSVNIKEGVLSFVTNDADDKFFSDSSTVTISDGAELNIDTNIETTIGGNISSENYGDGTVSKTGSATLSITCDNSAFTGVFNIKEGIANYTQTADSLYFGGNTVIDSGAQLVFVNSVKEDTIKDLSGEGTFTKEGSENLVLTGDNSGFSGNVNINEGTLSFNDLYDKFFGSGQINIQGSDSANAALHYTANSNSVLINNQINLNGNAEFEISGTGSNSTIQINQPAVTNGDNNTASYSNGTFVFNNSFSDFGTNGNNNSISFNNAEMQLGNGVADFGNDKLDATFNDGSVINMLGNGNINNLVFDKLTLNGDVSYKIDLDLKNNDDQHHDVDAEADMITYGDGSSGSLTINGFRIMQDGQLKDVEIQVLDGDGSIELNMNEQITAATSTEYVYSIKKSETVGNENTHIQISTTDYIKDPTGENFSLKNMHLRVPPEGGQEISEERYFSIIEEASDYKVLSNLGVMAEGIFGVYGEIDENGDPIRAINGNNLWALFNADSSNPDDDGSRELNIDGVKIYNATTVNDERNNGAAINIAGENSEVNLTNSSLEDNFAQDFGGAIYNDGGKLSAANTDFKNNEAGQAGAAIYNKDGEASINGTEISGNKAQTAGAVYNEGTLKLENADIINNDATNGDGGAIVNTGEATITTANINENTSTGNGGAIVNTNTGNMTITNAVVKDNTSGANGGAIYNTGDLTLSNVSFDGNDAASQGGAIYNEGGSLTISATNDNTVVFQNNTANGAANDIYTNNGMTINTDGEETAVNILSGIAGSGTIDKQGSGTFNITGDNSSYNGNAVVSGGSIVYHKQTENDSYINGTTTLKDGSSLVYNLAAEETLNGTLISETDGAGTFIKAGEAELTITGDNSAFSGTAQIQQGVANYVQSDGSSYFGGDTQVYDGAKFVYTSNNDGVSNVETLQNFSTVGNGTGEFVKEGTGAMNLSGSNSNFKGLASINEGSINYIQTDGSSYFGGKTAIAQNATLQFTTNNNGTDNVETLSGISGKGEFLKDGTGVVKLSYDNSDFEGNVVIENGTLVFNKIRNKDSYISGDTQINENGELEILLKRDETMVSKISGDGTFTKSGDSVLTLANDNSDFKGTVNLEEGTMILSKGAQFFNAQNFNFANGTTLDLRNSVMDSIGLGNVTLAGTSNLGIDVDLANSKSDFIDANSVKGDGNLVIKHMTVLSDTYYPGTTVHSIDDLSGLSQKVSLDSSLSRVMGPIYQYEVTYDKNTGNLHFAGGDWGLMSYNPSVIMPQAAAQVGGYLTMLNTYEDVFANMDMVMLLPKAEREMFNHRNIYAVGEGQNLVYAPTMIPEEETGAWFRPFTSFESVGLKNGPRVSNVSYGALAGVDSDIIHLKHGIDAVFTGYAGYNGSHQAALGSDIYQNGGILGVMGAFYKGNFFTGITANAGASSADLTTSYGRDDLTMLMSGVAAKAGYNWELLDSRLIIQPNYTMSYTFVNTFDYTNNMGVRISSDPLHAIQVAPGLKIIGNLKNGWQPYAGIAVVMNFLDDSKFKADVVSLPEMSIKPYVTYNLGVQKRWGERFTGYVQSLFRTGGRSGVGFSLGLRWRI